LAIITLTKVTPELDRPGLGGIISGVSARADPNPESGGEEPCNEVTLDMISAGTNAFMEFDPEKEEVEALIYEILYRAFKIMRRNRAISAIQP